MNELERIEEEEKQADRSKIVYKRYNKTYGFRKFKTIRVFGDNIKINFINMNIANDEQNHLGKYIKEFKSKTRPQDSDLKRVKEDVLNTGMVLLKGREMVFKAFESGIFFKPEQSSSDHKYTSLKFYNDQILSQTRFSSNSGFPLFALNKGTGLKILTPKQMLQRMPQLKL